MTANRCRKHHLAMADMTIQRMDNVAIVGPAGIIVALTEQIG